MTVDVETITKEFTRTLHEYDSVLARILEQTKE
jgi:hypothetical protein